MAGTESGCKVRSEVAGILIDCIGDDMFTEDPDWADVDLVEEYSLDLHSFVDIVVALRNHFAIDLSPMGIEMEDIATVNKATAVVEAMLGK